MRVIVAVLVIVVAVAALYFFGAGRGVNACIDTCQSKHCIQRVTSELDCHDADYDACVKTCYDTHGRPEAAH